MKTNLLLLLTGLFFALLLGSCKKDAAAPNTGPNAAFNASVVSSGTWAITSFTEKTENKTSDYSGMDFNFSSNGTVTITGTQTANGTWAYSPSVAGSYGAPASIATFTINIVSGSAFTKLSRTWNIGTGTATSLQLNHPQASEDEHVTFTKK